MISFTIGLATGIAIMATINYVRTVRIEREIREWME